MGIIYSIVYALQVISMWKIFEKAGEKGWKSIIPLYNWVVLCDIVKRKVVAIPTIILSILTTVVVSRIPHHMYIKYSVHPIMEAFTLVVLVLLCMVMSLMLICETYQIMRLLAEAFGKSKNFAIGLLLLYPVFICLIGLDDSVVYDKSLIE